MVSVIRVIGALGGRKFMVAVLNAALLPVLAVYLPEAVAMQVVETIATVSMVFIGGQAVADAASRGATSTARAA